MRVKVRDDSVKVESISEEKNRRDDYSDGYRRDVSVRSRSRDGDRNDIRY